MRIYYTAFLFVGVTGLFGRFNFFSKSKDCGQSPVDKANDYEIRIIGGKEVTPHQYPWMVLFHYVGVNGHCGGSLIHPRYVLTAAHCDQEVPAYAQLGVHNVANASNTELIQVKRFIHYRKKNQADRPPNPYVRRNDIALVELDRPVKFNDRIHPICLGAFQNETKIRNFTVAGWGHTSEDASYFSGLGGIDTAELNAHDRILPQPFYPVPIFIPVSPVLRHVDVALLNDACGNLNRTKQICAGSEKEEKDGCQGDSGGPLMMKFDQRYYIAGITSTNGGEKCGKGGIYTRVSFYLTWIEKIVKVKPNKVKN
ncbi:coagulation factor IX-like [Artemia franciscana]|uniref:Peptidase S1 domain-containing protein n=1 Tax=Artemia franciscana TaxID=6661 RepID=A0AA88IB86_ARTSF|nr:hypothetical protein QYM36_006756 [Artemia franciscana]